MKMVLSQKVFSDRTWIETQGVCVRGAGVGADGNMSVYQENFGLHACPRFERRELVRYRYSTTEKMTSNFSEILRRYREKRQKVSFKQLSATILHVR